MDRGVCACVVCVGGGVACTKTGYDWEVFCCEAKTGRTSSGGGQKEQDNYTSHNPCM